jgi:hypothetical protein
LAAWIFYGPNQGGLAAYVNANELIPPPRFSYVMFVHAENPWDYLSQLMRTWFRRTDIECFAPSERYLTEDALISRWSRQPGLAPAAFIQAKIHESRLGDLHPIVGVTRGHTDDPIFPPLERGLYELSRVSAIEEEDFGGVLDAQQIDQAGRADVPDQVAEHRAVPATADGVPPSGDGLVRRNRDESPLDRCRRLRRRKIELKAAGCRSFLKQIADEEGGLSTKRVAALIARAEALGPFLELGKELPRRASSPAAGKGG